MLPEREQNLEQNKKVVFNNKLNDWRNIRNKKLSDSDIEFLILLENYILSLPENESVSELKSIINYRKELRDITKWDNFNEVKDEIEMMDYLPDILK
jgi:hypothetical protein